MVRDILIAFSERWGGSVSKEAVLPYAAPDVPEARLDAVIRSAAATGQQAIDITVVSPLTQEMPRHGLAARVPGAAASAAAAHKREKYPGISVVPFVVEHFGRWGEDAIALAKRLAPAEGHLRAEAISELYQDIASAIQRANADAILAAATRTR